MAGVDILVRNPHNEELLPLVAPRGQLHVLRLNTRKGHTINAVFHEVPRARFTLLHSHGNAVDLGEMMPFLLRLGVELGCSVFAYDYAGYGGGTGQPREAHVYADIDAAWTCLREQCAARVWG